MNWKMIKDNRYLYPSLYILILAVFIALPHYTKPYTIILLSSIFMYIAMTLSWALFSGPTGYTSLATAAFFGVGLYTAGILDSTVPLAVVVICGGLISFILAFLIGAITLRLRGIYFAIFTFGLVELIKHLMLWWEINIVGVRGRFVMRADNATVFYILLAILITLLLTTYFLKRSRYGLALSSIGSCEEAAIHIGVNVINIKIITFATSAFFIGLTGTIMATRWSYIDPYIAFDPFYSFLPPLMAIFGGLGNIFGPLLGAAVFSYLQETLITRFPYSYMLIFGLIMAVTILYLPNGLIGLSRTIRRRFIGGEHADTSS
jgi:branched-chain amino acid transport system permease protein